MPSRRPTPCSPDCPATPGFPRTTLRAYFAAERNVSSTAVVLGVDRRTVTNRLRAIEELFGRPLKDVAAELETALRLDI